MAAKQCTVDYLLDQLSSLDNVSVRKMFGEYALYCDGKVAALICDNKLFVKITEPGKMFVGEKYSEGLAYPGAKPSMEIDPESIEDSDWLSSLVQITVKHLPVPKKKK